MHREHIFNAIRDCLLDREVKGEQKLNYTKLYETVNHKIKESRGEGISPRDFSSELKMMVEEELIHRVEDEDSKRKIKPIYLSLTRKAKIEHPLGILGLTPEQERLRRVYQLIFFYSAISPIRIISQIQMDKIKNDLKIESRNHTDDSNVTDTVYKSNLPTKYFRIIAREFSGVGPKGETTVYHYCKLLSFSEKDIVKILVNAKRRRTQDGIVIPFIHSLLPLTEQEVNEAFVILKDNYLIIPVPDKFEDGIRFVIADETLQDLISEIWSVHWRERELLKVRPPTEEEKQWLRRIYGDNEAMKIIADADRHRRLLKTEQVRNIQKYEKYTREQIDSHVASIFKKYQTKIRKYGFPSYLIENVCFRNIFAKREN